MWGYKQKKENGANEPEPGIPADEVAKAGRPLQPEKRVVFSCCYCEEILESEDPDFKGICLYDKDSGKGEQYWFCHESCFREKLSPDYNMEPE